MIRRVWLAPACLVLAGALGAQALAQTTPVVWDGGNAEWKANKWNGGQDANTALGRNNGSEGPFDIFIGDASQVTYDAATNGDFRLKAVPGAPTSLTINEGAKLTLDSFNTDTDGKWSQFDGDLFLDNGTLKRTFTTPGSTVAGGALILGSWRSYENQKIKANLTNGGRIENDGQLWFGASEDQAIGLDVAMTINNGHLDLTGGANAPMTGLVEGDLTFFYDYDDGTAAPKGEKYSINFKGAGSITVDTAGIYVVTQDSVGNWSGLTNASYEDLWNAGILRSHGINGVDGSTFANFFTVTGTVGAADYKVTAKTASTVTWDGGNDEWKAAKWNGGQTSAVALGRNNGSENSYDVVIGGGAQVTYDAATNGDFRLKSDNGPTSLTIKQGAKLTLDSFNTDTDGKWSQIDGDLNLDNGTLKRTFTTPGSSVAGGALILGSWRSRQNQQIDVNISNGGRIENDGQVWFGAGEDQGIGLEVTMTINNGHLDLTGGTNAPMTGLVEGDLTFFYDYDDTISAPKGEKYSINFTGSGSITVDTAGIYVVTQDSVGNWDGLTNASYLDLWNKGILQANGLSGLDGATFGTYFSVAGAVGGANYKLTSLLTSGQAGDFDGDGDVDGADFLTWQRGGSPSPLSPGDLATWKANFGAAVTVNAAASVGAVPEPTALFSAMVALCGLGVWRSRR